MLTSTGTAVVTATLALNAFAMSEPRVPPSTLAQGLKQAQCAIPSKQAKTAGSEWLGSGLQIVEVSCGKSGSILFAVPTDPQARSSLIAMQDWRDGRIVTGYRVVSPGYDRDSRTLSSTESRSSGDCGTIKEWQWTGWSFRLTHVWNKAVCDGEAFEWDGRERWQVFPKPSAHNQRQPPDLSDSKCLPTCSRHRRARLGSPASAQMMKNQPQPVAAATKPAPAER